MGYGSNVPDTGYEQPCALKRPNGGLPSGAGPFDQHVYLAKALVHTFAGRLFGRALGSEGGTLEIGRAHV